MSSQSEPIVTTGVSGLANRREIHDLVQDETQFSLYIQALTKLFKPRPDDPQSDPLSFFQIGGIHGLPPTEWDGSGGSSPVGSWNGYCTHGTTIFPTWHRPYVSLFEQALQKQAVEIAKTYTQDRPRWEKAAQDLRAPYWDWALYTFPPEEVISKDIVEIITPDGQRTPVENPLLRYTFNPIDSSFEDLFKVWKTTLRHPTPPDSPDAKTNVKSLKDTLEREHSSIRLRVIRMFQWVRDWENFSNHGTRENRHVNSLEAIHDTIHNLIGQKGHMSDASVAGFDPIFFLHHANVDRFLALWSALNPQVWVTEGPARDGTWTIPDTDTVNEKTALTPFREKTDMYWASSAVFSTKSLGYSYPEFDGLDEGNNDAVREAIQRIVRLLYEDRNLIKFLTHKGPPIKLSDVFEKPDPRRYREPVITLDTPGQTIYDWTIRIRVKEHELNSSFSVLFFLGDVPPSERRSSPLYVGSYHTFINSVVESCENCRNRAEAGTVIEGYVHLNDKIAEVSGLNSFEPEEVSPYLRDRLSWHVEKVGGIPVDLADIPSLEITVNATELSLQIGDIFPRAGIPTFYHGITQGRLGGHRGQ